MKKLVFLFCLFLVQLVTSAQENCLSLEQLQQLYTSDYEQISMFLTTQGHWSFIYDEPSVDYVLAEDTLEMEMITWKDVTVDPAMELNLYYRDSASNIMEYMTDQNCFLSVLSQAMNKTQTAKMLAITKRREFKLSGTLSAVFEAADSRGMYLIRLYNSVEWRQLVAKEPQRRQLAEQIFNRQLESVRSFLDLVDTADNAEDYQTALSYLDSAQAILPEYDPIAMNLPDYKTTIENRIRLITKKNDDKHILALVNQGVTFSEQGNLTKARDLFKEALSIDKTNPFARTYLDVVERKITIMNNRQTKVYDYKLINYEAYKKFTDSLSRSLNMLLRSFPHGEVAFNCHILFDTNANNLSSYNLADARNTDDDNVHQQCDVLLRQLMKSPVLLPVAQEGIQVNAQSDLPVWMNWQSSKVTIRYQMPKFSIHPRHALDSINFDFANFADKNSFIEKGNYTISIQKIHCLDSLYQQIYISKFHYVGPEAALYSFFVPGLGTLLATQGTRGGGLMGMFFGFAGCSAFSSYMYYHEKNKLNTLSPNAFNYQSTTNKMTRFKWAAIGSITLTGSVYLTSLVSALYRGIQNQKEAKILQEMLHDGPIVISPCSLKIQ